MQRILPRAILAPLILVAACATRGATVEPVAATDPHAGMDHSQHEQMQALPASAGPGYTVADVRFMQDMIGHHAQALLMAAMAPTHGAAEMVLRLAQKIDISQKDEIAMMKDWLVTRKQPVPDDRQAHAMQMPGMLTPEQLARLEAARGAEFDRLFLTFMIQHHRGALTMVDALFDSPGAAQDSDIFRFATDVGTDQLDEINVMEHMLDILATSRSESR